MHKLERQYMKRMAANPHAQQLARATHKTEVNMPSNKELPAILFDGFAVYQNLSDEAKSRTTNRNVADVLDAVVNVMRRDHVEDVRVLVPEGWVLVPVEPTEEMVTAALCGDSDMMDPRSIVIDDYRAMLAAAPRSPAPPAPPTQEQGQ